MLCPENVVNILQDCCEGSIRGNLSWHISGPGFGGWLWGSDSESNYFAVDFTHIYIYICTYGIYIHDIYIWYHIYIQIEWLECIVIWYWEKTGYPLFHIQDEVRLNRPATRCSTSHLLEGPWDFWSMTTTHCLDESGFFCKAGRTNISPLVPEKDKIVYLLVLNAGNGWVAEGCWDDYY